MISLLVGNDSTDVTFIPINQYGKYNQFVISNNIMGYGIDVCFVSIYGDITSIFWPFPELTVNPYVYVISFLENYFIKKVT